LQRINKRRIDPVPEYTVNEGDCILSIAAENGFHWETIWNHPNNADLKQRRNGDPNVLLPRDVVYIPEKSARHETRGTDQTHKFHKIGSPAQVRLRLFDYKRQPRRSVHYSASVDGSVVYGSTDADGYVTLRIAPGAREVKLVVTEGTRTEQYTLPLGAIDPIDSLSGVQQRLSNIGYPCGSEAGTLGEETVAALRAFQEEMNLPVTGELDDASRQKLKQMHGC
jgi:N-acetylmuramoyl-L-alanine amidase